MYLASTRFSDETWLENELYRSRMSTTDGCIYGSSHEIIKIPYDLTVFIIEMNNTQNQIEGIGMVLNRPLLKNYHRIHSDQNYNRFIYKGKFRLNRDKLYYLSPSLVETIEYILFREKNHMKRSMGVTIITQNYIKKKKNEKINKMQLNIIIKAIQLCFIRYFKSNSVNFHLK
jgi:hypothetical protein